jgi:hypothetical protein
MTAFNERSLRNHLKWEILEGREGRTDGDIIRHPIARANASKKIWSVGQPHDASLGNGNWKATIKKKQKESRDGRKRSVDLTRLSG